jgi:hypothetical protein
MSVGVRQKDPASIVNFSLDWADHLAALGAGITIVSSPLPVWTVPAGITKVSQSNTTTVTTIRLSGGTDGSDYEILCHVTLSDGQEDEKSLTIQVRQAEAGAPGDATDRANALTVLRDLAQETAAPTLTPDEVEAILDRCKFASTWIANKAYNVGDKVVPAVRNGHYYICTQPGTSQSTAKAFTDWSTVFGQGFSEGSSDPLLTWEEAGSDLFNPGTAGCERNVYDLGRAARECWLLKSRKSTQAIDNGEFSFSQWHEHCLKQAAMFYPIRRQVYLARG